MSLGLPLNNNSFGTKLFHPGLSSQEVVNAIKLAAAAYSETFSSLNATSQSQNIQQWEPITADLLAFGLDANLHLRAGLFYQASTGGTDLGPFYPGTAEAIVFKNSSTNEVALAFRGTAGDGTPFVSGDTGDWGPFEQRQHYDAFSPLFSALDAYIIDSGARQILVTGHSLGGAMVEFYMNEYSDGTIPGVSYEAVAVASPQASLNNNDSRILNYGHESDLVYSVAGIRGSNAVSNTYVVFDENSADWIVGDIADTVNQHSSGVSYPYTSEILLASQFYDTTDRDTRVIISLTSEREELEEVARDFFRDDPALILGRNAEFTTEAGTTLSADDILVGGAADDFIEGFAGDDLIIGDVVLFGSGGNDTMAGGTGQDTFAGTPGELNGDTIVDLEFGDRIALAGEIVEQEDVSLTTSSITIDADDGFFDFFGSEITINLSNSLPEETGLIVLEDEFYEGGSILEVVGATTLRPAQDFYTGTTSNGLLLLDWVREGDLSYSIDVLNDGTVLRPTGQDFLDAVLPMPADLAFFQSGGVNLNGLRGSQDDVLVEVIYSVSPADSSIADLVTFENDTVRYLFIGDGVDDRGGTAFGDPHLITFDNVAFDFQAEGDFVLTRANSGTDYEVQARFISTSSAVSVAQAMATTVDGITISVETNGNSSGSIVVGGVSTSISSGQSTAVGSGSISRAGQTYTIDHGNGDFTEVDVFSSFLNVSPKPSEARDPGSLEGLLGNANGTPADDFQLADGTVLTTPLPVETLYGDFAQSWLVSDVDNLLPGEAVDFGEPGRIISIDSLPSELRQAAEDAVDAIGITNPILREAAILDFALTGNPEFIEAAALIDEDFNPIVDTIPIDPVSNPVIVLTTDTNTLDEEDIGNQTATFTVSRGDTEGDLTVNYEINGSGSAPTDASDFVGEVLTGTVVIQDGSETGSFEVTIANDDLDEGQETFDVSIALNPSDADNFELLISEVPLTIDDDDEVVGPNPIIGTTGRDNLVGTTSDDLIVFNGGMGDVARGNGGNDIFDISANIANGTRDNTRIVDWSNDTLQGIVISDINAQSVRLTETALRFAYGEDNDVITITGSVSGILANIIEIG